MQARIYKETKTAMQSGTAKSGMWSLSFIEEPSTFKDPLMGWASSTATLDQVHLHFRTLEDALAYARRYNLTVEVINPPIASQLARRSYSDNFRYNRPLG